MTTPNRTQTWFKPCIQELSQVIVREHVNFTMKHLRLSVVRMLFKVSEHLPVPAFCLLECHEVMQTTGFGTVGTLLALTSNSWTTRRWVAISLQFMIRTAIKSESNAEQLRSGIITIADQLDKEPAFVSLWHTSRGQALQSEHSIVFISSCA